MNEVVAVHSVIVNRRIVKRSNIVGRSSVVLGLNEVVIRYPVRGDDEFDQTFLLKYVYDVDVCCVLREKAQ